MRQVTTTRLPGYERRRSLILLTTSRNISSLATSSRPSSSRIACPRSMQRSIKPAGIFLRCSEGSIPSRTFVRLSETDDEVFEQRRFARARIAQHDQGSIALQQLLDRPHLAQMLPDWHGYPPRSDRIDGGGG